MAKKKAAKKATKKTAPKRQPRNGAGPALPGMEDEFKVAEPVQRAADRYAEQLRKFNKEKTRRDECKAELIDLMAENKVEFVWIHDGAQRIHFTVHGKVTIETPKKPDEA